MPQQGAWPRPLLYRRLAPWLAEQGLSRTVRGWVIGDPDDVSSITRTMAARAAHSGDRCKQMEMRLYATVVPSVPSNGSDSGKSKKSPRQNSSGTNGSGESSSSVNGNGASAEAESDRWPE